jgi:DNA uptake protein ComE-like DNA-binding protein
MNRRAQALMVSLWVLIILALLAIDLGHEVALGARVGQYSVSKMKSLALAKSVLNRAFLELDRDRNDIDSLQEKWGQCVDSGTDSKDPMPQGGHVCVVDEERKININQGSFELLSVLLESVGINDGKSVARNIISSRDRTGHVFVNVPELILVKGMTQDAVQALKKKATVFGDGAININTVPAETLKVMLKGIAREVPAPENVAEDLADKIMLHRTQAGAFKDMADMDISPDGSDATNIFNRLVNRIVFKSDNFLIEATGQVRGVKNRIATVYERKNKKILYWHEG